MKVLIDVKDAQLAAERKMNTVIAINDLSYSKMLGFYYGNISPTKGCTAKGFSYPIDVKEVEKVFMEAGYKVDIEREKNFNDGSIERTIVTLSWEN